MTCGPRTVTPPAPGRNNTGSPAPDRVFIYCDGQPAYAVRAGVGARGVRYRCAVCGEEVPVAW